MKNFLKIPVLLVLFAAGTLLSGCVASAGVGYTDVGPYYGAGPYYGRAYPYYGYRPYRVYRPYPRPYYRPNTTVIVQPPRRGVVRNGYAHPNTTIRNAPRPSYHNTPSYHNAPSQGHRRGRVR